jgi:hypothetical protein
MAPTTSRPFNDVALCESTTAIGSNPVAANAVAPASGLLQRVSAAAGGTTTGTITVAVSINGGPDVAGGQLQIAAGNNARPGSIVELPLVGPNAIFVNEGDSITWTPSGGTAAAPGAFAAVIRAD